MTTFHYAVIEKPEAAHFETQADNINMENVDYKRQPDIDRVSQSIVSSYGTKCGAIRGGLFGLATNQIWVLSVWDNADDITSFTEAIENLSDYRIVEQEWLVPTVRPEGKEVITRDGVYVIRHIRMLASDIDEYTALCLETWPQFEARTHSRCYGVFRRVEDNVVTTLLMLTWYQTFTDWENSRQLDPADTAKWARRSEMELSHWAEVGRLG